MPVQQPPELHEFPGIRIEDVHTFGVGVQQGKALWELADRHGWEMRSEVESWNSVQVVAEWERELAWRRQCWSLLDDVLRLGYDHKEKLRRLDRLRFLIGDEAYYSGRMPKPTPTYKIGSR